MLSCRDLLASAHAGEKVLGLLEHPPPKLGGLSWPWLLLAALEVQDGGPAHYQSACVADGPGCRPASHRHELQDLTVERPEAEACGQHPDELPRPIQRDLLPVGCGYGEDHPALVGGDGGHVRARDRERPYDSVLTGVFAGDLLAHRAPEGGVTAPQRDQVLLVRSEERRVGKECRSR